MEKAIGPEAKLKAEILNGKITLSVIYDGKQVDGLVQITSDSDLLIDAIGGLIPGDSAFETMSLGLLKTALKTVSV